MLDVMNFFAALLLCTNSHFSSHSPLPTSSAFTYFTCSLCFTTPSTQGSVQLCHQLCLSTTCVVWTSNGQIP